MMSSSPAPLRPALGGRPGGARTPRLGLAIPPSPNVKPVGTAMLVARLGLSLPSMSQLPWAAPLLPMSKLEPLSSQASQRVAAARAVRPIQGLVVLGRLMEERATPHLQALNSRHSLLHHNMALDHGRRVLPTQYLRSDLSTQKGAKEVSGWSETEACTDWRAASTN